MKRKGKKTLETTTLIKLPPVLPEAPVPGWAGVELVPATRQVAVLEAERNPHMLAHLEQNMADLLINEVNTKLQVGAKPFCICPDARPGVPFYVHNNGSLGWHMEPADSVAELIPEEALFVLLLVSGAHFPVTDIRVGRMEAGTPDQVVSALTGHRGKTLRRYQHLSNEFRKQTVDLLADILLGSRSSDTAIDTRASGDKRASKRGQTKSHRTKSLDGRPVGTRTPDLYRVNLRAA